jgi:hypothetical protein
MSTDIAGVAPAEGCARQRRVGVAVASRLAPGCFNHSDNMPDNFTNDAEIAMDFPDDGTTCIDLYVKDLSLQFALFRIFLLRKLCQMAPSPL